MSSTKQLVELAYAAARAGVDKQFATEDNHNSTYQDLVNAAYQATNGKGAGFVQKEGNPVFRELLSSAWEATGGKGSGFIDEPGSTRDNFRYYKYSPESYNDYLQNGYGWNPNADPYQGMERVVLLPQETTQTVDTRTPWQQKVDAFLGADRREVTGGKTDWWKLLKGNVAQGLGKASAGFWGAADMALGGFAQEVHNLGVQTINDVIGGVSEITGRTPNYLKDSKNVISWLAEDAKKGRDNADAKYKANANTSRAAQLVNRFGVETVAAIPMALEAAMEAAYYAANPVAGGVKIAGGLATAGRQGLEYISALNSGGNVIGTMSVQGIKNMLNRPAYWTSYMQAAGDSYESAINDGMNEDDAALYAMINATFNAMIEVGGVDEALGGLQALPRGLHEAVKAGNKNKILAFGKDLLASSWQEGTEEIQQGIFERGLKAATTPDNGPSGFSRKWFSTDPTNTNAVINPYTAANEFIGGAAVGGILGGGEVGLHASANLTRKAAQTVVDSRAYTGDADALIQTAKKEAPRSDRQRIAEIQQDAQERAIRKGQESGYILNMGEARELYQMIQNAGKEEDYSTAVKENHYNKNAPEAIKEAFKAKKTDPQEISDSQAEEIAKAFNINGNVPFSKYATAAHEAYTYGKKGIDFDNYLKSGVFTDNLTVQQARIAWRLGSNIQTNPEETLDVQKQEERDKAMSHFAYLPLKYANEVVDTVDKTQDISAVAAAYNKAINIYAAYGEDLQQLYREAREGKRVDNISYLTPAQIAKAQQIGEQIRADRQAKADKAEQEAAALRERAESITVGSSITDVNATIHGVRQYIAERTGVVDGINSILNYTRANDPNATRTAEYQRLLGEAAEIRQDIKAHQDMIKDLEATRDEIRGKMKGKRKKGTVSLSGGTIDGTTYEGVDENNLTRQQKNAVATAQVVTDAVGIDVVFFNGPSLQDIKPSEGKTVMKFGAWSNGILYLNMNAMLQTKEGAKFIVGATMSHELTHFLQQYDQKTYNELKEFVVGHILKKDASALNEMVRQQTNMMTDMSYDEALDEIVANACQTMLMDSKAITELARENMTLAEKVADVLEEIAGKIRAAFDEVNVNDHSLYRAVRLMEGQLDTMQEIWDRGIRNAAENYQAAYTVGQQVKGGTQMQEILDSYSDSERQFWSTSKKIVLYENDAQLIDFVNDALNSNMQKKLYFGKINAATAVKIKAETGYDLFGKNVTLRADNVRKTRVSHNNENEKKRGQKNITPEDYTYIPDIVANADSMEPSTYEGRPAVTFKKQYGNLRRVVTLVDSGGSWDLFVQTMYVNEKRSIGHMSDANSSQPTPKTIVVTASNNNIAGAAGSVKNNPLQQTASEMQSDAMAKDLDVLSKVESPKTQNQIYAFENDRDNYEDLLRKWGGMSDDQITELFKIVDEATEKIKGNLEALDYAWDKDINDRAFSPVKNNSDPLYKISVDFSTLCRKRILQQTVADKLSDALDRAVTKEEGIAIRDALLALQEEGKRIEVACALCYVESARMRSQAAINRFLEDREGAIQNYFAIRHKVPKEKRSSYKMTEEERRLVDIANSLPATAFTTPEGLEQLSKEHNKIYKVYTQTIGSASHSKGIENDAWYRFGDAKRISKARVKKMNAENGLRTQSWSDFQVKHLIDYIAATIEISTLGAKMHAYTKVIDYVRLMGNTGVMINMSLIPTREYNGKLEYDNVEGFVFEEAMKLRDMFPDTAGTICIGTDPRQIWQLLESTDIDYVIPYHMSGMSKDTRRLMHIPAWVDFQEYQGEKKLEGKAAEENAKKYGVELLPTTDKNWHKGPAFSEWFDLAKAQAAQKRIGTKGKYGVMTGGYMAMQQAAEQYKRLCAERGLEPKFTYGEDNFGDSPNYWKLLIDRKMVNNKTGEIIEQKPIKPIFDMDTVQNILDEELKRYPQIKADQEEAIQRVTDAFLKGDVKAGMTSEEIAEVMKKPVENLAKVAATGGTQFQQIEGEPDYVEYNDRALVTEETLDKWMSSSWYGASNPKYAQAFITSMAPREFLNLTTIYDKDRIRDESKVRTVDWAVEVSERQPIQLSIDTATGLVDGHEGRHRMAVLERQGIESVPVLLFDNSNKYSKEPMESYVLHGQEFNGHFNSSTEIVHDVYPLNKTYRDQIVEKYSKPTPIERYYSKKGKQTVQFQQIGDVEEAALEHFGTTTDFRSAGYLLKDGQMLDFSGAHWSGSGSKQDFLGTRYVDHGDVFEAYEKAGKDWQSDTALDFIRRGNIRMVPEISGIELSAETEPTPEQYGVIREYIRRINLHPDDFGGREFRVDLTRNRRKADALYYEGRINGDRVVNDLRHYYKTGETRPQGVSAFYQQIDESFDDTQAEANGREIAYTRIQSEAEIINSMVESIRELTGSEKKSIKAIQDRLKISKTPEVRERDARRLAKQYIESTNSTLKADEIAGDIKELGDYIAQTEDISPTVINEMARGIAAKLVNTAQVTAGDVSEDETMNRIRDRIRGKKLYISNTDTGDIPGYESLNDFRRENFGRFTVVDSDSDARTAEHESVDAVYEELRNDFGDYYFPELGNQGEMLGAMAGYFDTAMQTVNPHARYIGEVTAETAMDLVRDVLSNEFLVLDLNTLGLEPMTRTERIQLRNKELGEKLKQLQKEKKLSDRDVGKLYNQISKLNQKLADADQKYADLKQKADDRLAQVRAEGTARALEAVAKERERSAEKIQALKDHYNEMEQKARERREESAGVSKYRKQIEKKAQKLFELLKTNSDKKHVPEVLKKPLAEFLETLNFTSKRQLRGGEETKKDQAFAARLLDLEKILANQQAAIEGSTEDVVDLGGYIDVSQENLQYLKEVAGMITTALSENRNFTINSMTASQLKSLSNFLSNLYTAINAMNTFMVNARYQSVREAAGKDIGFLRSLGKHNQSAGTRTHEFALWENGTPFYVFRRLGEGARSIFDGFTRGWERLAFNAQEIINFTESLYTDKEVREWKKTVHDIRLTDGSEIKMTTAQIMELNMLLAREQALKHIEKGGIRIGDIDQGRKGVLSDQNHYHLTETDIENIIGLLTPRQAEVARALQQFMARKGAEWGNEISMRRFGYEFYTEGENYYPIKTDSLDRPMSDTDLPENASMFRLLNLSASKSLNPKASNALVIGNIFDTFSDHMSDMAKLNGMGLPVLDAIKWFNYKERINNPDGTYDINSLQAAMEYAFGKKAGKYFRTLMKDINGTTESGDRGSLGRGGLLSSYKIAAVGANLRVALLQPTSYVRASAVIKPQYLVGVLPSRQAYREAMQYSGTAVWKSLGYYETDITKSMRGQIQHDDTIKDKIAEASMTLAEKGDQLTWSRLWTACKRQVKAEQKLNGEELMQATADLFREVIYASQVMDSTLTRSEIMRGKSMWSKLNSAFMAEPTLSYNIVMDAFSQYQIDERANGKAGAWQRNAGKIGKAFAVYAASAVYAALMESLMDALRDDDDDKYLDKVLEHFLGEDTLDSDNALWKRAWGFVSDGNLGQDLEFLGKLPFVKNFISMLQGYDNQDMTMAFVSQIMDVYKIATGQGSKRITPWGILYKTLQPISELAGLPLSNLTRDVVAVWNNTVAAIRPDWKLRKYDAIAMTDEIREGFDTYVAGTGISLRQYKRILSAANTDGNTHVKQDEMGEWLVDALARGDITEEQAQALWLSQWNKASSMTFDKWRGKQENFASEVAEVAEQVGFDLTGTEYEDAKPKTEPTPEPTPTPTPTPTPALKPAEKPAEPKKEEKKVTDRETFKKYVPVYSDSADTAYELYESEVKPMGISLEKYSQIIIDANADGKGTSTQEEMGNYLVSQVTDGKITQAQADAIWHTIWSKPKSKTFQKWLQENYS